MTNTPTRRAVMCGAAALSVSAALAACSSDAPPADDADDRPGDGETGPAADPTSGGPDGDALIPAADVPIGGGVALAGVIVVQPEEGVFRAFDPTCTHRGGVVEAPKDGVMTCVLHGSQFAVADGSVVTPPATLGLTEIPVVVEGGNVYRQ